MKKKILWIILLILGIIPFIMPLISGIYDAIYGYTELLCFDCTKEYGIKAFINSIYLYSAFFYPTYIIGFILMFISIIKLKKK